MSTRLRRIIEVREEDAKASKRWLGTQTRIWRSLSIVHAHHPELAKESVLVMALKGTLVGDIEKLEAAQLKITDQAKRCGRTMGIFADQGACCDGSRPRIWGS